MVNRIKHFSQYRGRRGLSSVFRITRLVISQETAVLERDNMMEKHIYGFKDSNSLTNN